MGMTFEEKLNKIVTNAKDSKIDDAVIIENFDSDEDIEKAYDYLYENGIEITLPDFDEESKDDDETENEDLEYKEIKELVAKTLNPIKDMDEFKNFKDLLNFLRMNHSNEYTMWENSLSTNKKEEVNKLFGTKRIIIQCDKKSSMQVPRRIVSIRRNPNNGGNP